MMEKMKKGMAPCGLIAIFIVSALALAVPVSAQPTADSFGVNDVVANPGTVVNVPVNITNAQNGPIISVIFDISYNTSVITVSDVQNDVLRGDLTSTWDKPSANNFAWGTRFMIVYDSVTEHAIQNGTSGSVVIINFTVAEAPGSTSNMNLSNIQLSDTAYNVGTAPAKGGTFRVDAGAPSVTNPQANPDTIEADGVQESRLNVTVEDDISGDVFVTVNLTQIGGPAEKVMEKINDTLYSTTTNASPGTSPGTYYLPINATDLLGNYNNTENFTLTVALPPTGTVTGKITYACNGTGIADATVNITQAGGVVASTTTDSDGNYTFVDVAPPGDYYVNVSKLRFWGNSTSVTVTAGGTVTANMMLWLKGDLNNNCMQADAGDLAKMKDAAVGKIDADKKFDLNNNGIFVDAGDVAKMKDASVGKIELV